jgi:hypothetical protein
VPFFVPVVRQIAIRVSRRVIAGNFDDIKTLSRAVRIHF